MTPLCGDMLLSLDTTMEPPDHCWMAAALVPAYLARLFPVIAGREMRVAAFEL
jgi:hypothetical protein